MLPGILKALRKHDEPPVEPLDLEAIRSRIGDPLAPAKPVDVPYTRSDERPVEQRSWRKVAGLKP